MATIRNAQSITEKPVQKRIKLSPAEIEELLSILTRNVRVVEHQKYQGYLGKALEIAPHPEDAPYVALALYLLAY